MSKQRSLNKVEAAMIFLRKILLTTDLSASSLAALEFAGALGFPTGAQLILLHIAEAHSHQTRGHRERSLEDARAAFEEFIRVHVPPDIVVKGVLRSGSPAEEIKRFAEDEGVDIIVMATHGKTGLRHAALGSVAHKVLNISDVPVLIVKPVGFRGSILNDEDVENELHLR